MIFKSAYAHCITPSDLQITPCKFARRHTISKSAYARCIAPDFFQICSCSTFFYCKTTLLSLEVQHASTFFNVTICGDTFLKHVWHFRFRTCALKKGKRIAFKSDSHRHLNAIHAPTAVCITRVTSPSVLARSAPSHDRSRNGFLDCGNHVLRPPSPYTLLLRLVLVALRPFGRFRPYSRAGR